MKYWIFASESTLFLAEGNFGALFSSFEGKARPTVEFW